MLMKALKSLATNGDHPSKRHVMQKFDWVHSSRYEFNMFCDENGVKPIFHTTSWPCVSSILQSATIYGFDVIDGASFHHTPELAARQSHSPEKVTLGFTWAGEIEKVDLQRYPSSHPSLMLADVLYDVPFFGATEHGHSTDTMLLRLYPGPDRFLKVAYLEFEGQSRMLENPFSVKVIKK